jgi:riboflavin-specific deaminase-like protein
LTDICESPNITVDMASNLPEAPSGPESHPDHRYDEFIEGFARLMESRGIPRAAGRIFSFLQVSDPREQTAAQIAAALGISLGTVSSMTRLLMQAGWVERNSRRGERQARYRSSAGMMSLTVDGVMEPTRRARELTQRGLELMADRPAADRARLEELNAGWLTRQWRRRPRVLVKVGLSLDGRVGFALGERADITGASGRRITSLARSQCDAVLVGAATVAADDPALTVRDERDTPTERQPLRVVLCRETLPRIDARVLTDDKAATLLLVPEALVEQATRLPGDHVVAEAYDVEAGLTGALEALGRRGINDVLIEAGPRLFSGLASEDLIDRLVTVTAGGLIGPAGPSFFAGPSSRREDALEYAFAPANSAVVGDVVVSVWERRSSLLPSSSRL